nr:MAG TPA: DNA replication regulator [Caudoviricetes sp.]
MKLSEKHETVLVEGMLSYKIVANGWVFFYCNEEVDEDTTFVAESEESYYKTILWLLDECITTMKDMDANDVGSYYSKIEEAEKLYNQIVKESKETINE